MDIPASLASTGRVEIDGAQAAVVVRIFEMFGSGHSPRSIASALNGDGIPSPGAAWQRERRRKCGWVASGIHGNPARGLGILNNELYRGTVIWNRSRWIRSAADSNKRRSVQNPRKDWIVRQDERLRIVSDALWQRVKQRQTDQAHAVGARVKRGLSKAEAGRTGAGPKFLLSSLLRCAHCGSSYAIAGRNVYACSGHTNGGNALCSNDATLQRHVAEFEVLAGIKRELRSPEVIDEICRRLRAALRKPKATIPENQARIAQLKTEIGNIADAIAVGGLRASPTLTARLAAAETELERLEAASATAVAPVANVSRLLTDFPALALRAVDRLEKTLAAGDITRARREIRDQVGTVTVEADEHEIRLYSEQGHIATAMLRASGTHTSLYGSGGPLL
jgi:hypothetical protein